MSTVKTVRMARGLSVASPWPALFLEGEGAIVVADLHLGLEDEREAKGVHVPTTTFPRVLNSVVQPAKALGCSKVILLGDVKHEFGRPREAEWWATKRLIKSLRGVGCEPEVVRGNHDNYIIAILKDLGVKLHQPKLSFGRFNLVHGHLGLGESEGKGHIIMGHEHPVVAIRDDVGAKHRYKAFLDGMVGSRRITVLPSVSPLAYGSDINEVLPPYLLSPILKGKDMGSLTPYTIEVGITVKRFPRIGLL